MTDEFQRKVCGVPFLCRFIFVCDFNEGRSIISQLAGIYHLTNVIWLENTVSAYAVSAANHVAQ